MRRYVGTLLCVAYLFATTCIGAEPVAAPDLTAIDVLMHPDDRMLEQAKLANARLRKEYPAGFTLDATHIPHISIVQRYVYTKDLDKVYAAVAQVLTTEHPEEWNFDTTGYYSLPVGELGLMGIVVEPTPKLRRFQERIIEALSPFTAKSGGGAAFVPRTDGKAIQPSIVTYVDHFVPLRSGCNYNPHVTVGLCNADFARKLLMEPYHSFSFKVRSVSVYHLGDFGTAQKELWRSKPAH